MDGRPLTGRAFVVLATMSAACITPCARAADSDVSALLLAKTQAFSDAGQRGDGAAMTDLLDDHVVFFNENGESATKHDLTSGGAPSRGPGVKVTMKVTDWQCRVHGDVAVASFIDDQILDLHTQTLHSQFRSVETWQKSGGTWRMIGSQTMVLQNDPPAITVDGKRLDSYVGAYEAAPAMKAVVSRSGNGLAVSINGAPAVPQQAETADAFFTPGAPRLRKIFRYDAHGVVTGFVSRREGHDIVFKRIAPA